MLWAQAMAQAVPTLPKLPPITGDSVICAGSSTALTDAVHGGSWSSSNTAVAIIGSATGVLTGVSGGTATITYDILGIIRTTTVTIDPLPAASVITGSGSLCIGATAALADATSGGSWSSASPAIASISAGGLVTGVTAGTSTIYYTVSNSCGTATATRTVTVSAAPVAGSIYGSSALCAGTTLLLTDAAAGGSWSSASPAIASISATGLVSGLASGTAVISYTVTNSCGSAIATHIVTINTAPIAGTISGGTALCTGAAISLTDAATGGTWSSASPATASVSGAGMVTGMAPGMVIISYTVINGCGSATATHPVTVNAMPVSGAISGITTVCDGATTPLTDAASGGSWHSSNSLIASVSATGMVTGVAVGTAIISYTVTNSCGSAMATTTVSVGAASSAGTIAGPTGVYVSSTITLTDIVSGGTWAASNSKATVSATGIVTGVASGTVTISYTITGSCGTVTTTKLINVSYATVSPISAYYLTMCTGQTLAFWDWTTGGTWSMSPASVATVSPTGVVTGITAGSATLSYTYGGTTVTTIITVNASPAPITGGLDSLCVGSSMQLSDPTPGGVWSSDLPSKASVSSTGYVTCTNHSEMNVPIYYTMPNGCKAVFIFVTDSVPGFILGPNKVCAGSSITLIDTSRDGYWSGSNANAAVDGSGNITGIAAGTAAISFTLSTTGCYKISVVTVNPLPAPISGTLTVCTGSVTFLTDATTPTVSWTSSNHLVATATASGAITGIAPGTSVITFTATNGCTIATIVTVNATPGPLAPIMGPSSISHSGGSVTVSDATPGGVWSSYNTSVLTVGSITGIVTAVVSTGSTNINYTVTNSSGCSATVSKLIGTSPAPPHSGGTTTTMVGSAVSITDELDGGEWLSSDNSVATVEGDGIVTGIAPGSTNITHTAINSNGDQSVTITQIVVTPVLFEVTMIPNPNRGSFTLHGVIGSAQDEVVTIEITDILGRRVYSVTATALGGIVNTQVQPGTALENGVYLLNVSSTSANQTLRFVVER